MAYSVVKFDETMEVEVVPSSWICPGPDKSSCFWPAFKNQRRLFSAIRNQEPPQANWTSHSIRYFRSNDTYDAARHMARAEEGGQDMHVDGNSTGHGYPKKAFKRKMETDCDLADELVYTPAITRLPSPVPAEEFSLPSPSTMIHESQDVMSTVFQSNNSVVRALTRCEARIDVQNKLIEQLFDVVRDLVTQVHQLRGAPVEDVDLSIVHEVLPVDCLEKFDELERNIATNSHFKALLRRRLTVLGGADVKASVKNMIETTMKNEVQLKFNWEGRTSWKTKQDEVKKSFKATNLCQLIIEILTQKTSLRTDEKEIAVAIMLYLRNAPDRGGGRGRRVGIMPNMPSGSGEHQQHADPSQPQYTTIN